MKIKVTDYYKIDKLYEVDENDTVLDLIIRISNENNLDYKNGGLIYQGRYLDLDCKVSNISQSLVFIYNHDYNGINLIEKPKLDKKLENIKSQHIGPCIESINHIKKRLQIIAELISTKNTKLSDHIIECLASNNNNYIKDFYYKLEGLIPNFKHIINNIDRELNFKIPHNVDMEQCRTFLSDLAKSDSVYEDDKIFINYALHKCCDDENLYRLYLNYSHLIYGNHTS